ncbi:MAG TPA: hypothetical protein VF292_10995 [Rhodanobacteraceae bacterium]
MAAKLDADDAHRLLDRCRSCPRLVVDACVSARGDQALEPKAVIAHSTSVQPSVATVTKRESSTRSDVVTIAFLLVLLVGVAVPVALLIWQSVTTAVAVRTSDAGTFVSATASQGGYFSPTLTNVQTTTGSVVVEGTFSAPRGRTLAIEDLNKNGLHLCAIGDLDSCLPISGHWAGHLVPTPQAARVFNFVRYGLSTYNLQRWMAFGLIFAFVALALVFTYAVARRS